MITIGQICKIVVVGGGITGLSAAYYIHKLFGERNMPVEVSIIEKNNRLGGKIYTLRKDGFVIEKGPDSFLARKSSVISLTQELGLEQELTGTNPHAQTTYILHKGRLHKMPQGLALGIPTQIASFSGTKLLSPAGKARAAMDLLLPRKKGAEDEALGSFIERRLGKEMLDHIIEPLLAGIYAGDTHSLSLRATFPRLYDLEQNYGSLIRGMLAERKTKGGMKEPSDPAPKSLFLTYKQGLATLVNRLSSVVENMQILTGQDIMRISLKEKGYTMHLPQGDELSADGIVMAIPPSSAMGILPNFPNRIRLEQIPYASVINVALAFNREDISRSLDGSGFLVPRTEGRTITACTWVSSKWLHTAPRDKALLRVYVGRFGSQEHMLWSDQQLLSLIHTDLREIMGIRAEPLFCEITRLPYSMPQYPVGHHSRLNEIRTGLQDHFPGITLCGAGYDGVGVPDCIRQGKEAAERMLTYMLTKSHNL